LLVYYILANLLQKDSGELGGSPPPLLFLFVFPILIDRGRSLFVSFALKAGERKK